MNFNLKVKKEDKITKDVKESPKKNYKKYILLSLGVLVISLLGFFVYKAFDVSNNIGIKLNPGDILNPIKKDPELKKDSTGKYTSALLVGIDTRGAKSDLMNTDSMIIATYNYETGNITMVSVPRDTYVKVPNENWYTKINGIYGHGESLKKGSGMNYLRGVLQNVTGIEIQYHALVDLQGFKKMIDAVGGVTINVENTFTDYQYPTEAKNKPVYETVTFKKGPQKMNGETALKYARSRHSSDNGEGSDFSRAKRQQKVISALKDKVLSTQTLLNPQKILELMSAVKDNVKLSEVTNEDIQAGINLAKKQQEKPGKAYSFVLEPSFGNYQLLTTNVPITNAYAIAPTAGLDNYTQIKTMVKMCLNKPALYSLEPIIKVYDVGLGSKEANEKVTQLKKKFPYTNIVYMGTLFKNKSGTIVYSKQSKFTEAVEDLATYLNPTAKVKPEYITTNLNGEDITILLGKTVQEEITEKK